MKYKLNYKSDKDWCIQEFDDDGNQLGEDFTPDPTGPKHFHSCSLSIKLITSLTPSLNSKDKAVETIYVSLEPVYLVPFGSQKPIKEFDLTIYKKSDRKRSPSIDTFESDISIFSYRDNLHLSIDTLIDDDKFDELKELIINKKIDKLTVFFSISEGMYLNKDFTSKVYSETIDNQIELPDLNFIPPSIYKSSEPIRIDFEYTNTTYKYPQQEVNSIVDKIINSPRISGVLQTIKYSIFAILIILFIESIKNNYFS